MRLSHGGVASVDKRESAAASGDAAGRPAARTGRSALHLPSTPDGISFTARGHGLSGRWMQIVRPGFILWSSPLQCRSVLWAAAHYLSPPFAGAAHRLLRFEIVGG